MRNTLSALTLLCAACAAHASTAQVPAATPSPELEQRGDAINALLIFRQVAFLEDTTKLDRCSVFDALHKAPNYLDYIAFRLRPSISTADTGKCGQGSNFS